MAGGEYDSIYDIKTADEKQAQITMILIKNHLKKFMGLGLILIRFGIAN